MRAERVCVADAEMQLARALVRAAAAAGLTVAVERHRSRPWASATFTGAQHRLALAAAPTAAFEAWLAALPDAELMLRGHLVASLAVDRSAGDAPELAVLTLEDR